jgi:CheY-like chemotaxis protein
MILGEALRAALARDVKHENTSDRRQQVSAHRKWTGSHQIGYEVICAADGEDGLGAAHENIPDLILLDMMLPKMSGLDVLRALKLEVLVKHIPVIATPSVRRR